MGLLRKLLRHTFYTAAAVSTLLLLATLILWPLSHYRRVYAQHDTTIVDQCYLGIDSGRAVVADNSGFGLSRNWGIAAGDPEFSQWSYLTWNTPETAAIFVIPPPPAFLGVSWCHFGIGPGSCTFAFIPLSYLALLFSILPLVAFRSIRRRRKLARVGLCRKCGYDLRAHALGEKCPECGTAKKGGMLKGRFQHSAFLIQHSVEAASTGQCRQGHSLKARLRSAHDLTRVVGCGA